MIKLQIWWIIGRDFGTGGFSKEVENEFDAGMLLNALTEFDKQLGDEIVFTNAGGLNEWDGEWVTYYDEGDDFDEVMANNQEGNENFYLPTTYNEFKLVCQTLAEYSQYVFRPGRSKNDQTLHN